MSAGSWARPDELPFRASRRPDPDKPGGETPRGGFYIGFGCPLSASEAVRDMGEKKDLGFSKREGQEGLRAHMPRGVENHVPCLGRPFWMFCPCGSGQILWLWRRVAEASPEGAWSGSSMVLGFDDASHAIIRAVVRRTANYEGKKGGDRRDFVVMVRALESLEGGQKLS